MEGLAKTENKRGDVEGQNVRGRKERGRDVRETRDGQKLLEDGGWKEKRKKKLIFRKRKKHERQH